MGATYQDTRSRWQCFHDKHAPLFVSDNGAPCTSCGATGYGFKESEQWNGRTTFDVFCYCCHAHSLLTVTDFDGEAKTLSAAMRAVAAGGAS